jgi:hypothetical protein
MERMAVSAARWAIGTPGRNWPLACSPTSPPHVSNILTKLQVADRAQAIVQARDAGLGQKSRI